jgi:hypothetical protein
LQAVEQVVIGQVVEVVLVDYVLALVQLEVVAV